MQEPSPRGPTEDQFPRAYRIWFLALAVLISTFSVIDRTALITLGGAIKQDLKLSDMQFGLISGVGFALFYAILGLPLARLADTRSRVRLISRWACSRSSPPSAVSRAASCSCCSAA